MSPAPETEHQNIVLKLAARILHHLEKAGGGRVLVAPMDVILSDTDVVQPDVVYVSKKNLSKITAKNIRGAPDLVIEVLSPSTANRDIGLKKDLYARYGVKEYWIANPASKTIEVFRLGRTGFGRPKRYGRKTSISSALLPSFILDLKEVF